MKKIISLALVLGLAAFFSPVSFAGSTISAKPAPITFQELVGVWGVTAHELLIVGRLGTKNTTNAAAIEFFSDPTYGDSFHFVSGENGIADFSARCGIMKKGAKIAWHIVMEDTDVADETIDLEEFEASLSQAIFNWAAEHDRQLSELPELDIRSIAYKPIVVIKKTGSPKLGILQVKGSVSMVSDDGTGVLTRERKNFKYKCQFAFTSADPEPSLDSDIDD